MNQNIKWQAFNLNSVFSINSTKSGIDGIRVNREGSNNVPYITRTEFNNGIGDFIPDNQDEKFEKDLGNSIIIGLDTQTVFYQETSFYTGQNIQVLRNDKLNKKIALFMIPLIQIQLQKFNWGGNGATLARLNAVKIILPSKNNLPHWNFMEDEGEKIIKRKEKQFIKYINEKINKLEIMLIDESTLTLENKKWDVYKLEDIFIIQRGKRLTRNNQKSGYIPYISSTGINNGVNNFIGNDKNVRSFENVSTIANSGTVGSTFYHNYKFVASDHVTALINDNFNKYHYLFINTLLKVMGKKYHFNREMNDFRLSREKIMLPIDENNNLDLYFMEKYMQQVELNKLIKLRDYLLLKK